MVKLLSPCVISTATTFIYYVTWNDMFTVSAIALMLFVLKKLYCYDLMTPTVLFSMRKFDYLVAYIVSADYYFWTSVWWKVLIIPRIFCSITLTHIFMQDIIMGHFKLIRSECNFVKKKHRIIRHWHDSRIRQQAKTLIIFCFTDF